MSTRSRGKEGSDDRLFGTKNMQLKINEAVVDLSYLLERGFAEKSALQLVGNRYRLNVRQQRAVQGMSVGKTQLANRLERQVAVETIKNQELILDGFNVLILLESALSGAYLFKGLDNCYRDLSSVHGTYKKVTQTETAIHLVAAFLEKHKVQKTTWIFDKPVSNSGRLKSLLGEIATTKNYNWEIILDNNPDKMIAESNAIAVSSDAWILNNANHWFNLVGYIIEQHIEEKNVINSNID